MKIILFLFFIILSPIYAQVNFQLKVDETEAQNVQGVPSWLIGSDAFTASNYRVTCTYSDVTYSIYRIGSKYHFSAYQSLYPTDIGMASVVPSGYYALAWNNFETAWKPSSVRGYLEYSWEVITYHEMTASQLDVTGIGAWLIHIGMTDLSQFQEPRPNFHSSPLALNEYLSLIGVPNGYTKINVTVGVDLLMGTVYMGFRRYYPVETGSTALSSGYYASGMYFNGYYSKYFNSGNKN